MANETVREEVRRIAEAARAASGALAQTSAEERNAALAAMAAALRAHAAEIVAANAEDVEAARAAGTKESLVDRLMLDEGRIEGMAAALEDLAALPDPLGRVQDARTLESGIELERVSVPLGVVAVVYEARPNVTADAAGICLKSGNAAVLRGGSMAARSNEAVARVLADAAEGAGMPRGCIGLVASTDRAAADELMQLHGTVDVLIPRGGAGLIQSVVMNATVPVIETGTGNCHVYVDASADLDMAARILVNAKCQRPSVCNAAESLLVHKDVAAQFLPMAAAGLAPSGVKIHGCPRTMEILGSAVLPATEEDYGREYLGYEISCRVVDSLDEAIDHINTYNTGHSECIVTRDYASSQRFLDEVDAAAVYVNASTRFTDGFEFGFGAEIGISTQKLHARGPMGLTALTTTKFIIYGNGQVRE